MHLRELTGQDCRMLDGLTSRLSELPDWDGCGSALADGLTSLVDAEYCIYNETDLTGTQFTRQHVTAHIDAHEKMMPVFYRHLPEHPILARVGFQGLFADVAQISDFSSMREYHNTGLYTDFYRYIGVDHQILTGLGIFGGVPVICCAHRERRAFTMRECQIFMALRVKITPVLKRKAEETVALRRVQKLAETVGHNTGLKGLENLTATDVRMLTQILTGRSYREIAETMHRSPRTIEKQVATLLHRLGLERRTQLEAAFAALHRNT